VTADTPPRRTFPPTRISVVALLKGEDEGSRRIAADTLVRAYWGPVAALLELRWNLERADAEDLAQDFFSDALEKDWFARYDPARGRFRTFLRTCVDRFAANAEKARTRLKRGGGVPDAPLEAADVAGAHAPDEFDVRIHDEWVSGVLSLALDAFRASAAASGKQIQVAVFEAYDVEDPPDDQRPTYRALAERFGIPETQVTNYLAWARREYRRHVLDALRALAGNDDEFREDARDLLGARAH
jgi:DNA-directed RNA polymerase specialized sigma24 family protein